MSITRKNSQELADVVINSVNSSSHIVLNDSDLVGYKTPNGLLGETLIWDAASLKKSSLKSIQMTVRNLRSHLFDVEKTTFEAEWVNPKDVLAKLAEPVLPASQMTHAQIAEMENDDLIDCIFADAETDEILERVDRIMETDSYEALPKLLMGSYASVGTYRGEMSDFLSSRSGDDWPLVRAEPEATLDVDPDLNAGCTIFCGPPSAATAAAAAVRAAGHVAYWGGAEPEAAAMPQANPKWINH